MSRLPVCTTQTSGITSPILSASLLAVCASLFVSGAEDGLSLQPLYLLSLFSVRFSVFKFGFKQLAFRLSAYLMSGYTLLNVEAISAMPNYLS